MFDYIKCDYPLPLTDEVKEKLPNEDWSEITFQTKSLDCFLETYTIEEDGQIYAERKDRYIDEKGAFQEKEIGIEKVEYTGQLLFYFDFLQEDHDLWIEFKALVWKGDIKEIELYAFRKMDNTARLETQKKFQEAAEKSEQKYKKWWWKPFKLWCYIVKIPLFAIRWLFGLFVRFTWTLERWFTGGTFGR